MQFEHIIIGAGPAGLQMGSLLANNYVILEKSDLICSFFHKFPRQRKLISINKGKDLRFDWNSFVDDDVSFRDYTEELYPKVEDYLKYAEDYVKRKNLNIHFNRTLRSLEKRSDGLFYINGGEYIGKNIFVGTGLKPRPININVHPSIKVFTYENMPLDREIYRDKTVVIVGSGNAALETADFIAPVTKFTTINGRDLRAYKTHYPGHARSVNFTSVDSFFLKAGSFNVYAPENSAKRYTHTLEYRLLKEILETGNSDIIHKIDIAIFCTGFYFENYPLVSFIEHCPTSGFPITTKNYESIKTPGIFFIGATSQQRDYKKGTSAFIHGFRYNCQYIARYLKGLDYEILNREDMIKMVFRQLNESSCLLHRFDYFCDLIEKIDENTWKYTKEIPYEKPTKDNQFTIRLGYTNPFPNDSFSPGSFTEPKDAHLAIFIHPLINTKDKLFEIGEDVFNEFSDKLWHIKPFMLFLDVFENKITIDEMRKQILMIPDKRGGRDLFWK